MAEMQGLAPPAGAAASEQLRAARRSVRYTVLILFGVNLFNYMDRTILAVLTPLIKADLVLTDKQIGALVGIAFFVSYAICGIPIARFADRGVRRTIIAFAVGGWSLATALCGAAHNFLQLLLGRVGVAMGESGSYPATSSLVCDLVPLPQRPAVFAVLSFGNKVGITLGMGLAGWLGEQIGWRGAFVTLGSAGILYAVLIRLTLREPPRGRFDPIEDVPGRPSIGATIRIIWDLKPYRYLVFNSIALGFAQFGLQQWWPSYYTRTSELGLTAVGLYLGTAMAIGGAIGILVGGAAANRLAERDARLPLLAGAAALLLAAPVALVSLFVASPTLSLALVALVVLLWNLPNGAVLSTLYSTAPAGIRATAGALSIFIISVTGYGLGPFVVGWLSDLFTPVYGPAGLRYAMLFPIATIPLAALFMLVAANSFGRAVALPSDVDASRGEARSARAQEPRR